MLSCASFNGISLFFFSMDRCKWEGVGRNEFLLVFAGELVYTGVGPNGVGVFVMSPGENICSFILAFLPARIKTEKAFDKKDLYKTVVGLGCRLASKNILFYDHKHQKQRIPKKNAFLTVLC